MFKSHFNVKLIVFLFSSIFFINCNAQPEIENYLGAWTGQFEEENAFEFEIELTIKDKEHPSITLKGNDDSVKIELKKEGQIYVGKYEQQLRVKLMYLDNIPKVFLKVGHHLCFLDLVNSDTGIWRASWKLLLVDGFLPTMYISIDKNQNGTYYASPFFKEPGLHYMFGNNFKLNGQGFIFNDIRSMINFQGQLGDDYIQMELSFLKEKSTLQFHRDNYENWRIGLFELKPQVPSTILDKNDLFGQLTNDLMIDSLEKTHNIVIQQSNEIIYEAYLSGYNEETPHDTRSAAKSFASSMIGIAIEEDLLESEDELIKPFFHQDYPEIDWSEGKDKINIHHLLTMSTGMDMIDFGLDRMSYANEGAYQNQEDWTGHILEAPMISPLGSEGNYGSGSPHLIGPILEKLINYPIEYYIHEKLFGPLQITNYRIQSDNKESPYFGGGWYLTARDLVKFGQLYLNGGSWDGNQIISKRWIERSMKRHVILENTISKNPYGYLFWHEDYQVNGQVISSIECRGSGGQYLFMIPELELVVAITSGNYRNGKFAQPEKIIAEYILPQLVKN